ncbi:M20/M25/M40 family metallo-hydrolase [Methyloprofundus sedimenti]|uniref:M20/M25/M40 family metallo-hydrolase n=1 Tax=Methyloprofundus sedimenti TaxID=1420851 RepID=UPI0009B69966|nr:M20/M25/M40 family metallo-hydrolase [Methyloprofundus sedimenti]
MKKMRCISTFVLLLIMPPFVAGANEIPPERLFKMAKEEQAAFLETLQTLVNIDSGTGNEDGLSKVENILVQRLTELGANVELKPAQPGVGNIVLGHLQGAGDTKFLLMIHYDTVFANGEARRRPFRSEHGRIYGPGVADAKGSLALILHALKMLNTLDYNDFGAITVTSHYPLAAAARMTSDNGGIPSNFSKRLFK